MQKEPTFNRKEYSVKTGTAFYECYRERFSRRNRRPAEQSIVFSENALTVEDECLRTNTLQKGLLFERREYSGNLEQTSTIVTEKLAEGTAEQSIAINKKQNLMYPSKINV